jgi:hypothetical protein
MNAIARNTLVRRRFLASLGLGAGAHLLAPMTRGLVSEALGNTPRKRFILFTSSNGFPSFHHAQTARSATDFDLNNVMQPFAPFKRELTIINNLHCPFDVTLHGSNHGGTTNTQSPGARHAQHDIYYTPGGPSIDRFIAQRVGMQDRFSSLLLGPAYSAGGGGTSAACSDGPGKGFSGYAHPMKAYDAIFRGLKPGQSAQDAASLLAQDRSALDAIRADIARLSGTLAGPEKARFDQYLESLRALERQLGAAATTPACKAELPKLGTCVPSKNANDDISREGVASLAQIGVTAMRCGLTHVLHMAILSFGGPQVSFCWIHPITEHNYHHENIRSALDAAALFKHNTWAAIWKGLRDTPEGNGTMADSAVGVYFNVCGGAHHRGSRNMPAVILGNAGGALKTGRYHRFPEGKYATGHLWLTIANAVGVKVDSFGSATHSRGGIPELT